MNEPGGVVIWFILTTSEEEGWKKYTVLVYAEVSLSAEMWGEISNIQDTAASGYNQNP